MNNCKKSNNATFDKEGRIMSIHNSCTDHEIEEIYLKYVKRLPDSYIKKHFADKEKIEIEE